MGSYSLFLKRSAARELDKIPEKPDRIRIVERIRTLSTDPGPTGTEKIAGREELFRVRQGNYRIIYNIDDRERSVTIIKIGHRRDVYR